MPPDMTNTNAWPAWQCRILGRLTARALLSRTERLVSSVMPVRLQVTIAAAATPSIAAREP